MALGSCCRYWGTRPPTGPVSSGELATFRRSPLMSGAVWRQLRDYNRPDFHPDDRDTTELVEQWRTTLFGADGTLNDKLARRPPEPD